MKAVKNRMSSELLEWARARAAKIAGAATRKQMLIIQLAEIKEAFKE